MSSSIEKGEVSHSSPALSTRSSNEKAQSVRVERAEEDVEKRLQHELYNAHIDVSGVDERKLLRKLDWALVPWLSFLYLLSFLDCTSIGNARVRAKIV